MHYTECSNILYRCRDEDGVLLYIGICRDIAQRMANHRQTSKHWFCRVATVATVPFADYRTARDAEVFAIRSERPLFNKQHNGWTMRTVLTDPFASPPDLAAWHADVLAFTS